MAAQVIDTDPQLAHEHALSASRRGGRIAMVRETLAITAYTIGDYALALRELRTYRRISGKDDQLALMIDSERGLGRPDRALELGRSVDRSTLPSAEQVQVAIAMSGARLDQGQADLARTELEIPQLDETRAFAYSPALFRAYAEVLAELGEASESERWNALADRAETALDDAEHDEHETIEVFTEIVDVPETDDDADAVDAVDDVEEDDQVEEETAVDEGDVEEFGEDELDDEVGEDETVRRVDDEADAPRVPDATPRARELSLAEDIELEVAELLAGVEEARGAVDEEPEPEKTSADSEADAASESTADEPAKGE